MKWDKWGNSYKVKKGDHLVSLSDFRGSTTFVEHNYSTVTDLMLPTPNQNFIPYLSFKLRIKTHLLRNRKQLPIQQIQLHRLIKKQRIGI